MIASSHLAPHSSTQGPFRRMPMGAIGLLLENDLLTMAREEQGRGQDRRNPRTAPRRWRPSKDNQSPDTCRWRRSTDRLPATLLYLLLRIRGGVDRERSFAVASLDRSIQRSGEVIRVHRRERHRA